jgi:hypothetical protein
MSTILLSFKPKWFSLLENEKKKFEYIDDSDLLNYLKTNLTPLEETHQNDFSFISNDDIC